MSSTRSRWTRLARTGAAVIIGLGATVPVISACGSAADNEQVQDEQVEESEEGSGDEDSDESAESADVEETDPAADVEE